MIARWELITGDSVSELAFVPSASIDSLVTDPPAGIEFMGKDWDSFKNRDDGKTQTEEWGASEGNAFARNAGGTPRYTGKGGARDLAVRDGFISALTPVFEECLRVLKPGAFGLVWALPRTAHWTTMALENAGFEIRDVVLHLFGTGFPKGTDKAKIPVDWRGWNTALKPGGEHWILIRKPLIGTLAENLADHGTGALNIDGCRLGDDTRKTTGQQPVGWNHQPGVLAGSELGRWPANVTLDEQAAAVLDEQAGHLTSGSMAAGTYASRKGRVYSEDAGRPLTEPIVGSEGGASRFFYVAKPSRAERDLGCELLPAKTAGEATDREEGSAGIGPRAGAGRGGGAHNFHPTVKPQGLMRWLVRLITPPNGLVLDPFAGSGSTGVAVLAEGHRFIGIEREPEYSTIATARLEHAARGN